MSLLCMASTGVAFLTEVWLVDFQRSIECAWSAGSALESGKLRAFTQFFKDEPKSTATEQDRAGK